MTEFTSLGICHLILNRRLVDNVECQHCPRGSRDVFDIDAGSGRIRSSVVAMFVTSAIMCVLLNGMVCAGDYKLLKLVHRVGKSST